MDPSKDQLNVRSAYMASLLGVSQFLPLILAPHSLCVHFRFHVHNRWRISMKNPRTGTKIISAQQKQEKTMTRTVIFVFCSCVSPPFLSPLFFPSCIGNVEAAQYGEKKSTSGHAKNTVPWTLSEYVLALFRYPFHRFLRLRTVPPPYRPSEVTAMMMVNAGLLQMLLFPTHRNQLTPLSFF